MKRRGAGEMTQLLSALSPPPEDLGSTPTATQWLTALCNSSSKVWCASSGLGTPCAHVVHGHM